MPRVVGMTKPGVTSLHYKLVSTPTTDESGVPNPRVEMWREEITDLSCCKTLLSMRLRAKSSPPSPHAPS